MKATDAKGNEWTGERQDGWWLYRDSQGRLFESREAPAYRIVMDNARIVTVNGQRTIAPICAH